ncbi:MAG: hypothetical protein ACR2PZ_13560 [Pseudomonadales bacterium]
MKVLVGDQLPTREHDVSNVQLMLYNAALWNGHRIHFDEPYAKEVEGYAGLVIAGPLIGDWLNQCVEAWLGDAGCLLSIEYSNRAACYVGEVVTVGGQVTSTDQGLLTIEVFAQNAAGDVLAPGVATARLVG